MWGDIVVFLAAAERFEREVAAVRKGVQFGAHEIPIALFVGVAIGVVLFGWAYLRFRKKRRKEESERNKVSPSKAIKRAEIDSESGEPERRRRRKRRRRRDHRPRNPTLDKTGGLPAPRPDDDLPKF
jgi:hypothetical protein